MLYFEKLGKAGRLGNQMFQYAALVATANRLNCQIEIPFSQTELPILFNLSAIDQIYSPKCKKIDQYEEAYNCLDQKFFSIQDNTNLFGFFQSFKYFENYSEQVRSEFKFKHEITIVAEAQIREMKKNTKTLVSVHVRRGDYVRRDREVFTQDHIKLCKPNYYNRAMRFFKERDVTFVIFSDDIEWCKENITGYNTIFIDGNTHYVDLCMMSLCDHNIICTSTFSWWGAWLNNNPNKLVIVPRRWLGIARGNNTQRIYYENCLVIDSPVEHCKYHITNLLSYLKMRDPFYQVLIRLKFLFAHPSSALSSLKKKISK